jgi:Ni/Co efflux regulator RcnB
MMKRAAVGILLVSLFAGTAMAGQGYRGPQDHRDPPRAENRRDNDHRHDGRWDNDRRDHDRRDWRHDNRRDVRRHVPPPRVIYRPAPIRYYGTYHPPRGYYTHSWRRGERLPYGYYQRPYVIADYDRCGLRRPPVGYHWVRVNHDAVLAVIATGVVLDVAYNLFG